MAIYHLSVQVMSRKTGRSAVAAAAYRAGARLRDNRLDREQNFSRKHGIVHSEVLLPENAPEIWQDRERLWNDVEACEVRKDAQLAREVEFAIPREMSEAQGIALEPQTQIGASAQRIEIEGSEAADRAEMHREIARNNGARIIADPSIALDAITHQQSTFTRRDLARFAHRHSDGIDQFNDVLGAMGHSPGLVELGKDSRGHDRFTTRDMIETEQRLHRAADLLAEKKLHGISGGGRERALARAATRGLVLSGEQADALAHVTGGRGLGIVVGYAGTGKSAMLGVAREAWEASGLEVRGVALSGIAAENLESGSGIASRTIASMEHGWQKGRDMLTNRDVLVIDEAGMVGTRQLERVLSHAAERGARVVLVGDPQQLQSIEAGAAFRSLHERHGGIEIETVRRQREGWQRDATRDLATGGIGAAIGAYDCHGMLHAAVTREQARDDLITRWDRDRQASPDASRIILTHTNAEVRTLNEAARQEMREAGDLGADVELMVERGVRRFGRGDRIMFLQNERGLGVKNGTLGTIEDVSSRSMSVRTDNGADISFDLKDYDRIDHGYAATIHKAQGMTVDRTHLLATPGLDAHGSYVAMSRHREQMDLHYGRDDFATRDRLIRTLSRDRAKDMALDYDQPRDPVQDYAERRGINFRARVVEIIRKLVPERFRDRIDGVFDGARSAGDDVRRPESEQQPERGRVDPELARQDSHVPETETSEDRDRALRRARTQALVRHARAVDTIFEARERGGKANPEQVTELRDARKHFEDLRPFGAHDAEAAYRKDPDLAREAAESRVRRAVRALQLETELRTSPERRADRFVARWRELDRAVEQRYAAGDYSGYDAARNEMGEMARGLERDPQLESILANRKKELGITFESGRRLGRELAFHHGIDLDRGRGLGL